MMHLSNEVLDGYAEEIAAMGPLDCWGKIVAMRVGDEGSLRFHSYRLSDGRWSLSIEELREMDSDFEGSIDWGVLAVDWEKDSLGYFEPSHRGELLARDFAEIRNALTFLRVWAHERILEPDKHPGAKFLWEAWGGDPIHDPKNWPDRKSYVRTTSAQRGEQ